MRDDADERPLERTHVVGDALGDQLEDRVVLDLDVVDSGALAKDRHARCPVGRRQVGDEPGLEALAQALLDAGQLARQPVAGEHQLPAGVVERVEGVEELLLGLRLAGEELDVVDQEHVDVAVEVLEALERLALERGDEAVGERLDRRVADGGARDRRS